MASLILGFDPLVELAKAAGFEVTKYDLQYFDAARFALLFARVQAVCAAVALFMYLVVKIPPSPLRTIGSVLGMIFMLSTPYLVGKTGSLILDFGMPGYAFVGSLQGYVLLFVRPRDEIINWSFRRFFCSLLSFSNDPPKDPEHPWRENIKGLKLCGLKLLACNIVLYTVPPPQLVDGIQSSWAAYGYSNVYVYLNLWQIGGAIEGISRCIGLLLGVEMGYLMQNPSMSTNFQEFWRRWNQPIAQSFRAIAFGNKARKAKVEKDENGKPVEKQNGNANGNGEVKEKRKVPFWKQCMTVFAVFGFSGVFHEYMNYYSFGSTNGSALTFFLGHGLMTCIYHYFKRYHPQLCVMNPWVARFLVAATGNWWGYWYAWPQLRGGMFEELKQNGIFGPINHMIWVFGH